MESFFKNKSFLDLINRWRIHLAVIVLVSTVLGVFISSPIVMTPKYKSTAFVYPVNVLAYSEESTTEQMLQVFSSNDIKEKMLNAFNLDKHYNLDKNDPHFYSYFLYEFSENVSISKTEYESVNINVLDKDPKVACNMVDSLISFFDQKMAELHRQKNYEMVYIKNRELNKKRNELDSLEKKQTLLKTNYNIIDIAGQTKELTRGYMNLVNSGKGESQAAREIDSTLKNFKEKTEEYNHTGALIYAAGIEYNTIKNDYEKHLSEVQKKITYSQVVEHPIPADKKAYPVRWAVVAVTLITSLIFSLMIIAFIDSKRKKA